ncbi:uncharacterized protein [Miscanthus floridulus]|uniref:uncharacterized protein n=1 Tax=Miscanthus floridulus TaxID=154761 RepID=UPI0034590C11
MANRTLGEFSAPTTANIRTGPIVNVRENGFELKPALINMVQSNQFCEKAHEDASEHLQHFLEICSTFIVKGVTQDAILLRLFLFSLLGKVKQWFHANKDRNTTWDNCSTTFLAKFFPTECPHHGTENWLLMQTFYHGLTNSTHETMDAATGGAFLSLTLLAVTTLVEKMASNQG